eukprot:m.651357 g.651357  ORF g.651357 m.651357 type:complete len:509 (+) comp22675_c0_seq1:282-1808(+)
MQRGIFRSRDPVENLRIEVTLRKVTAASSDRGDAPPSIASQGVYASEKRVLHWQQKVFSWAEIVEYRDDANCETPLEHHYHKEVNNVLQKEHTGWRADKRIFTYVDVDDYVSEQEMSAEVLVGPQSSTSTFVTRRMSEVRRRHGTRGKRGGGSLGGMSTFVHVNDVVTTRPTARDMSKRVIDTPYQVMYVMADLSDVPSGEEENTDSAVLDTAALAGYADAEHVLCTIKIDANGVLEAYPTFNHDGRLPYRIQHRGSIYEYEIKHVSTDITPDEAAQEEQMVVDLHTRHQDLTANKVGKTFASVPRDVTGGVVQHVFGEIVSAKNFEYDNLYVRLVVDVPERTWTWRNRLDAQGHPTGPYVTQISKVCNRGSMADTALFSYPFELDFARKNDDAVSSPTLLLQVNSLDFFARHRPEGYGYIRVPMSPGVHVSSCKTRVGFASSVVRGGFGVSVGVCVLIAHEPNGAGRRSRHVATSGKAHHGQNAPIFRGRGTRIGRCHVHRHAVRPS